MPIVLPILQKIASTPRAIRLQAELEKITEAQDDLRIIKIKEDIYGIYSGTL